MSHIGTRYREPASLLFGLALIAESIEICRNESISTVAVVRWVIWSVLFLTAKEQNTPLALVLGIFLLRLRSWSADLRVRGVAALGLALILAAGVLNIMTSPQPEHRAAAYNVLFLAIIPESRDSSADLEAFGLSPRVARYSGTNTWSVNTGYYDPEVQRSVGNRLTLAATAAFFLGHPRRMWRHVTTLFSASSAVGIPAREPATPPAQSPATSLRPEFCGNFEQAAGYPPGTRSRAFAVWIAFHEQILSRLWKYVLVLLPVPAFVAGWLGIRRNADHRLRRWVEFAGFLSGSCLVSFLTAAFGDALDNVKHMYLFNAFLDMCLLWLSLFAIQSAMRFCGRGGRVGSRTLTWPKISIPSHWDSGVNTPGC
jgi:hypothetical protein